MLFSEGYFAAKDIGRKDKKGSICHSAREMFKKREECLNECRIVCWEWALEDQSRAKKKKSRILVETVKVMLNPLYFCFQIM